MGFRGVENSLGSQDILPVLGIFVLFFGFSLWISLLCLDGEEVWPLRCASQAWSSLQIILTWCLIWSVIRNSIPPHSAAAEKSWVLPSNTVYRISYQNFAMLQLGLCQPKFTGALVWLEVLYLHPSDQTLITGWADRLSKWKASLRFGDVVGQLMAQSR